MSQSDMMVLLTRYNNSSPVCLFASVSLLFSLSTHFCQVVYVQLMLLIHKLAYLLTYLLTYFTTVTYLLTLLQ